MRIYFSHSYRDERINRYFDRELKDQGVSLVADQKSSVWCVAKIERYLSEQSGFLSVIPRRILEDQALSFSPYIGTELSLARRSGLPRLLFVDDEILNRFRDRFPRDAIPFVLDAPESDKPRHQNAIRDFRKRLDERRIGRSWSPEPRQATVVAGGSRVNSQASQLITQSLADSAYRPTLFRGRDLADALEDVDLFEQVVRSELCVFLLDPQPSPADAVLGMAHAHAVPSIRLRFDAAALTCEAGLTGVIAWSRLDELANAFQAQLQSFRKGFVEVIDLQAISTTQWTPEAAQLWDPAAPETLTAHVRPTHHTVVDVIGRVRILMGGSFAAMSGRAPARELCNCIYDAWKLYRYAYEKELHTLADGKQAIRSPTEIQRDKAGTCLDLACLFASLLQAAHMVPIILLIDRPGFAHALVGYLAPGGMLWDCLPAMSDVLAALRFGDIVVFEPTGAVESENAVAADTREERRLGEKVLDFTTAVLAGQRLLESADATLRYFLRVG